MTPTKRTEEELTLRATAFLFTDVEDSMRLRQTAPEAMRRALAMHRAIGKLRAAFARVRPE